jgi:DNA-binding transcriptional MerR regulator
MNIPNNNRYNAQYVAALLGVYKRTLFNWEEARKIPKAKRDPMNNYRFYTKEDIDLLKKLTKR